jgi:pyruvate/2-oxoglutarate dehydrogenase complex dihydrolipoamide acyltransferase (E2) component
VLDASNQYFDINTLGDSPVSYELKMKPVKRVKLSITFDASRVDEVQAVQFLNKLQNYLNDPESMLL